MPTGLESSPVEVQQCEMVGPAVPTEIGSWRELAVEVQQCPLRSGAGEEARRRGGRRCGELC